MQNQLTIAVVGGGAAGFFGAIRCAEQFPQHKVFLFEKTRQLLSKVRISGGGRCNVTHACFDPAILVKNYPRGCVELRGPFSRYQPRNTIEWFESRGVLLKTEEDGRMFPITDSSETIIQCFLQEAKRVGVEIYLEHGVHALKKENQWIIEFTNGKILQCDRVLLATGSSPSMYSLMQQLGHTIIPLVPSLFTFNIPTSPFLDLAGISVNPVSVSLPSLGIEYTGPLLCTHWGLSGPVILKLSAWAARELYNAKYQMPVKLNWVPDFSEEELKQLFSQIKNKYSARLVSGEIPFPLPKQLWKKLLSLADIEEECRWSSFSHKHMHALIQQLRATNLSIHGKTTYKQEFVTCGGVALEEVNFKTMESRCCPGLFFAGEVLNIDGVTGGFNFQNAWTTSWIAGQAMGQ
jgi:predicted Rossmann fold flavoprotein